MSSAGTSLRVNNFDLIRLVAATQVLIFHGLEHVGPPGAGHTLFARLLSWFPGVPIFFVVSGFLVSMSYERSPSLAEYLRNRMLRIYPALWICLVVSILSVAVFATPFEVPPTPVQLMQWWAAQMSIVQFFNPEFLRGYGVGVLNGSLWTIPVELQFYAALPLLYLALRRSNRLWTLAFLLALAVGICSNQWLLGGASLWSKIAAVTLAPYLYMFLLGVLLQRYLPVVKPMLFGKGLWWLAAYLMACTVATALGWKVGNNDANPALALLLAVTAVSLSYSSVSMSRRILGGNDISYGTYIYHMVVFNVLLELGIAGSYRSVAIGAIASLLAAAASWRLVESPFLRRKHVSLLAA